MQRIYEQYVNTHLQVNNNIAYKECMIGSMKIHKFGHISMHECSQPLLTSVTWKLLTATNTSCKE